jgi:Zn-dependent peptidase ImmA (M78 family)
MRIRRRSELETSARDLLRRTASYRIPVPIHEVADGLGLQVEAASLGNGVSGVLVVENGRGTIGYNSDDPLVRQRFTVAHEIAHFVLHQTEAQLFIDRHFRAVYRRDLGSTSGEDPREVQANRFAAALLMPEELVLAEVNGVDFDLGDEQALKTLAESFQVSAQAMSLRLANLGIFPHDPD